MNLFRNLKIEFKNKKIYFLLSFIFILFYQLCIFFQLKSWKYKSIIDILSPLNGSSGLTGKFAFVLYISPILFCGICLYMINFENDNFIIKMKDRKTLFKNHILYVTVLSLILSIILILTGYFIGALHAHGFENFWPKNDPLYKLHKYKNIDVYKLLKTIPLYIVILKILILKFLGFSIVGTLTIILKNFINNKATLALTILILPGIDFYFLNGQILLLKFCPNIETWINQSYFIATILYLILIFISLYLIGNEIYKNKDFLSKD